MASPVPVWKRVVGGLIGIVVVVGLIVIARSQGASGEQVQRWQEAIVFGAAAAGVAVYLLRRRNRR